MRMVVTAILAGVALSLSFATAQATGKVIGVSWSNFQEERWKTDEAAMKAELAAAGANYVTADARSSPQKQLADIDGLIAKGAEALIVLAKDADAIVPAVAKAKDEASP